MRHKSTELMGIIKAFVKNTTRIIATHRLQRRLQMRSVLPEELHISTW